MVGAGLNLRDTRVAQPEGFSGIKALPSRTVVVAHMHGVDHHDDMRLGRPLKDDDTVDVRILHAPVSIVRIVSPAPSSLHHHDYESSLTLQ